MFRRPGFFEDWGRHGLGAAWDKRWGSFTLGGQKVTYDQILAADWNGTTWYLNQAIVEQQPLAACWAFEGLLEESHGNKWYCLNAILPGLQQHHQATVAPVLEKLLLYVKSEGELRMTHNIGGYDIQYQTVLWSTWDQLTQLLNNALAHANPDVAAWAFEGMLIQTQGDVWRCWPVFVGLLTNHREEQAVPVVKRMVEYVEENPEQLKAYDHGLWASYLLGKAYLEQAQGHRGSNKSAFLEKRPMAMHFLGHARKTSAAEAQQPSGDPYRQAAMVAGVAALAAAAYETTFYMAYKGTRTGVSMSSNE